MLHPLDTTANAAPIAPEQNNPEDVAASEQARVVIKAAYDELDRLIPEGRHKALAMTAIETAAMWAVKAFFHRR